MPEVIRVHGARVNNLKDVSVEIPKRRLTVFTGVSGSGKSSLVFDTIAVSGWLGGPTVIQCIPPYSTSLRTSKPSVSR